MSCWCNLPLMIIISLARYGDSVLTTSISDICVCVCVGGEMGMKTFSASVVTVWFVYRVIADKHPTVSVCVCVDGEKMVFASLDSQPDFRVGFLTSV